MRKDGPIHYQFQLGKRDEYTRRTFMQGSTGAESAFVSISPLPSSCFQIWFLSVLIQPYLGNKKVPDLFRYANIRHIYFELLTESLDDLCDILYKIQGMRTMNGWIDR